MNRYDFSPECPGQFVKTTAYERVRGGQPGETRVVHGDAFVPDRLPPSIDWIRLAGQFSNLIIEAERGMAAVERDSYRLPNPHLLLGPIWRREARLSSQIENTIVTPEEIVLVRAGRKMDRTDPQEVVNYIFALEHGLRSPLPLCNRLFKEMHHRLLEGVAETGVVPGAFRSWQAYVGKEEFGFENARYVPPPPGETIEVAMAGFESFINRSPRDTGIPDLVSIAIAHYQFEAVHPFDDGNGRLGRLIIALSLCRTGVLSQPWMYVSEYFAARRNEYYDLLLAVSQKNDWEPWIEFVLQGFVEQAISTRDRVLVMATVLDEMRAKVQQARNSALLTPLVESLFESPLVTYKRVQAITGVTKTAARHLVERLMEFDILSDYELPGRERYFMAWPVQRAADQG